jgi:hypothetical protein
MKTWNYHVETFNLDQLEKRLNEAGLGGWELVTLLPHRDDPYLFLAVFKQPSQEAHT